MCTPTAGAGIWRWLRSVDGAGVGDGDVRWGKATLLEELHLRGFTTVDTDHDGWLLPDRTWDEPRMARLLAEHRDVVVSGTMSNQGRSYDRFDHVVLLTAPLAVLLARERARTTDPYGTTAAQRAEIASNDAAVTPLLRAGAGLELDGCRPVAELADAVEALLSPVSTQPARGHLGGTRNGQGSPR